MCVCVSVNRLKLNGDDLKTLLNGELNFYLGNWVTSFGFEFRF